MKIRAIGHWLLLFGSLGLLWSGGSQRLFAGQNYPNRVTVFGGQSAASTPAPQAIDPAEEADIRQLMDLLETKAAVTQTMNSMANDMRPLLLRALPPGPYRERLVQLFFEKFSTNVNPQHLMDLAVPVYAQYLSDDDIKGLIQFYKTPLGQKWVKARPKVAAGVLPAAHAWGRTLGRQTMIEVIEEHPELAQELKAAQVAAHQR